MSPPPAAAWFGVLDSLGVTGTGAFSFTASSRADRTALGRSLSRNGRYDILHFVPLYYPSASRNALADALDQAAGTSPPSAPRAQFVVGALRQALPAAPDRAVLRDLGAALRRTQPVVVEQARIVALQQHWDGHLARALTPFLRDEQLDAGTLWVLPALGPEGRLFSGLASDRADNIVAVGTGGHAGNGALYHAVREFCFPLVSRTADGSPEFKRSSRTAAEAARRSGIAAVRCGAELLDRVAPAEARPYRDHWLAAVRDAVTFDAAFPPDALLAPGVRAALSRYSPP